MLDLDEPPCHCRRCAQEHFASRGKPFIATFMSVCPLCGDKRCPHADDHRKPCPRDQILATPYHYTECGLSSVWLNNGFIRSQDQEHGESVAIHETSALDRAIALALVSDKPFLHGTDIRFLRGLPEPNGMTQSELGGLMGVSGADVALWEHNREWMPRTTETLIRLWCLDNFGVLEPGSVATKMRLWADQDRLAEDEKRSVLWGTWSEDMKTWFVRVGPVL